MSRSEEDDLELQVSRYLDGDITDDEFEKFLAGRSENISIEQLRAFKSRVERIEELYRQMEEPSVPNGYWETFADRVAEKLPDAERITLKAMIRNIIRPWEWPAAAYGYIGALASVLLIVLIATTLQHGGRDLYTPAPAKSTYDMIREEKRDRESAVKPIEEQDTKQTEKPAGDVAVKSEGARKMQNVSGSVPKVDKKEMTGLDESYGSQTDKGEVPAGKSEETLAEAVRIDAQPPETSGARKTGNRSEPAPGETVEDLAHIVVADGIRETPKPSIKSKIVPQALQGGETADTDAADWDIVDMKMPTSTYVVTTEQTWNLLDEYDNKDPGTLRSEVDSLEAAFGDSSYASAAFEKCARMKSAIALATLDSVDINDAVSAIDTLLVYKPNVDKELWRNLRSMLLLKQPLPDKP